MESELSNPIFIILKATLACAVALIADYWLGNPDHVSSTFVAVLCISPTVLIGLRNAWAQILGSFVGGIWGVSWLLLADTFALPLLPGLPLAVGLAVASTFLLKIQSGYPVAAFTALFMVAVPQTTPLLTFETRFLALFVAAVSSFLINALVSAMLYQRIYARRVKKVEGFIETILIPVFQGDQKLADRGFALLNILQQQLRNTLFELQLRRAWTMHKDIHTFLLRTQKLSYLLHLVLDLRFLCQEENTASESVEPFLEWLLNPDEENFVFLPDHLLGLQKRIVSVLKDLKENPLSG
jgi:uncharacterized membrane protein YgaE (UPF0421/DUF939 family)